jgi:hypothetical protein
VQDVLAAAVAHPPASGRPLLARPVTEEVSEALQQALALAACPSPGLRSLALEVAQAAQQELAGAAALRELMGPKAVLATSEGGPTGWAALGWAGLGWAGCCLGMAASCRVW